MWPEKERSFPYMGRKSCTSFFLTRKTKFAAHKRYYLRNVWSCDAVTRAVSRFANVPRNRVVVFDHMAAEKAPRPVAR